MKRSLLLMSVWFAITLPLMAEGAGGVEITQGVLASGIGGSHVPLSGIGGFGYGVLKDGTVVGGFGMGIHTKDLDGGYGGTMQGWQHRWGPLVALATTKIGFGGLVNGPDAGFSMLGAGELQLGVLVLPWFNVGLKGGVVGTVTFYASDPVVAWTPTVGVRFSWGAF